MPDSVPLRFDSVETPDGDLDGIKSVAVAHAVERTFDSLGLVDTDPNIVSLLDWEGENDVSMLAESERIAPGVEVVDSVAVIVTTALYVIVKLSDG